MAQRGGLALLKRKPARRQSSSRCQPPRRAGIDMSRYWQTRPEFRLTRQDSDSARDVPRLRLGGFDPPLPTLPGRQPPPRFCPKRPVRKPLVAGGLIG